VTATDRHPQTDNDYVDGPDGLTPGGLTDRPGTSRLII